jgi:hypothetical protein
MDRQQKIEQIRKQSGRVSRVSNLEVNSTHVHLEYRLEPCNGILTETGKLEVLKLLPKSGVGPSFIARWDQKPEHLDIDMHGASNRAISKFRNNKDGYFGHHTSRTTDPDKRIFEVKIETPAGVIFDGAVSFSITYEMTCVEKTIVTDTLDAVIVRADRKSGHN